MLEIASVVERTRKYFASVSQLEAAVAREPEDRALQLNLSAMRKLALQSQEQLLRFSEMQRVEVCNYRLVPETSDGYALTHVARSLSEFQNLFTQIHDALLNGPKSNAVFGKDAQDASTLEFAYSYSGSLGMVFLAQSERDFFEGKLDKSIEQLYRVIDIDSRAAVRDVAGELGNAVVKRIHDWSQANVRGGFAADVRWHRSDGRNVGEVVERRRLEKIVEIIEATSDQRLQRLSVTGMLVGGDIGSGAFHFIVPNGADFRGRLAPEFQQDVDMTLGKMYEAVIQETRTEVYAIDKVELRYAMLSLKPAGRP